MSEKEVDINEQINVAAYYLSQRKYTYDNLCWMLAERELLAHRDPRLKNKERVREKAAEIYFRKIPYDILVWLISEHDIKLKITKTRKPKDRIV
ncbi:MAG: hypothetical protein ACFE8L_08960 [Candidatus Hodarchaeota archaeon]